MTDRNALLDKLKGASYRAKLEYLVWGTIIYALEENKISPATALDWVRGEELMERLERK